MVDSSQDTWGPAKGLVYSRCSTNVVLNPKLSYSDLETSLSPSSLPSPHLQLSFQLCWNLVYQMPPA